MSPFKIGLLVALSIVLMLGGMIYSGQQSNSRTDKQTILSQVDTVSESTGALHSTAGLLLIDESFRVLVPLNKPINSVAFQSGLTANPFRTSVSSKLGRMLNFAVLKQQVSSKKLLFLYRQLRI